MFHLHVPVLEKVLRPIMIYFAIIFLLRVCGKRELAQLNPFDLVVLLSVSNTVQNAIIGDDNSVTGGLVGAVSLFGINYVVVRFLFRHRRLDQIIEGSPATLIAHGQVNRDALAKELLTESELSAVVHRQGYDELQDVETCTLEPGGVFAIKGKKPASDELQHAELLAKFADLQKSVDLLRARLGNSVN